jgi:hypothetical protein
MGKEIKSAQVTLINGGVKMSSLTTKEMKLFSEECGTW